MDSVERWLWSGTLLVWERLPGVVVIMYIAGTNKDIAVCDLWHRIRRDDLTKIRGLCFITHHTLQSYAPRKK
jgi:hypothetical protein